MAYLFHGFTKNHFIGNLHRECVEGHSFQMSESALSLCFFCILVDAERKSQDDEREDDTQYTHRIGDGIAGCDGRSIDMAQIAECLLCRTETRCIGYCSRENTCHRSDRGVRDGVDAERGDDTQGNDDDAEQVETLATVLEGRKETWSHFQTDGINEEYQTELFEEVEQVLIQIEREMPKDKTDEENPCQAKGNTFHLNLAETQAQCDDQCKYHDRMGYTASPKVREAVK